VNEWEWQLLEDKTQVESIEIQGVHVRRGDRVRLRPRAGGDVFDLALEGKIAAVESIEQDYEGKLHVCVVVEDDPGRDIGLMRQPGHRFFFAPSEVEPAAQSGETRAAETKRRFRRRSSAPASKPFGFVWRSGDGLWNSWVRPRVRPDGGLRDNHSRGCLSG
jgi:hypothetical protein